MLSIFAKEVRSFLSSLIAYIVMIVFLLAIGLFMWVFPESNVLDYGYADMNVLFDFAPWVFIFLISAITMRSFSEEKRTGTIEFLTTRPVSDLSIILGKYFAGVFLVFIALIPTLLYYYTIYTLGAPKGNLDTGAIWGSYLGLLLLGACYVGIGTFASSLTDNQIVAFVLSMFLCFFFYKAPTSLSDLKITGSFDYLIDWLGIEYHYLSISRGVVDTRSLVYFISFSTLFIGLTKLVFSSRKW